MSLNDKVALVTGAAQGMGRAIAIRLATEGASVVATDINGRLVEQTTIDIRELGHDAIAVEADIGDIADIDRVVVEALNAFGRIDITGEQRRSYPPRGHHGSDRGGLGQDSPGQCQGRVLLSSASRPGDD